MSVIVRFAAVLAAAVWLGCSTTRVTSRWTDPAVSNVQVDKVLVVAVFPAESVRRNLEEQLAAELASEGAAAFTSAQFIPDGQDLTRENVRKVVEAQRFDAVLVAIYQGTERQLEYVPGTYDDYFGYMYPTIYSPGYVYESSAMQLESRFFDAGSGGKLVWAMTTSTVDPRTADKEIPRLASKIVDELQKAVDI